MTALLMFCLAAAAWAAPVKVVVDTDMGTDDVRALALLKSLPEVEVLAAVSSDGGMSTEDGWRELSRIFMGNTLVGMGRKLDKKPPEWRHQAEGRTHHGRKAGKTGKPPSPLPAVDAIRQAAAESGGPFTYLCLGPLTNLADALKEDPGLKRSIQTVLYYGGPHYELEEGMRMDWNTGRDTEAARAVLTSGLSVVALGQDRAEQAKFDSSLYDPIVESSRTSKGAQLIVGFHKAPGLLKRVRQGTMFIGKEIVPLFLAKPSLAVLGGTSGSATVSALQSWDNEGAKKEYLRLLRAGGKR